MKIEKKNKKKIVQEIGLSGKELRQNQEFPIAHKHTLILKWGRQEVRTSQTKCESQDAQ